MVDGIIVDISTLWIYLPGDGLDPFLYSKQIEESIPKSRTRKDEKWDCNNYQESSVISRINENADFNQKHGS